MRLKWKHQNLHGVIPILCSEVKVEKTKASPLNRQMVCIDISRF